MGAITVETELLPSDYFRLTLWASLRNVFLVFIYGVNLAAVFLIIPGILSGRAKPLTPFQLIFQAFILIGLPCILFVSSRTAYRKLPPTQRSLRYLFTDDAVETVTRVASSTISWVAIQKVVETSTAFYVSSHKNLYQVVPKRSFKDDADIQRFRDLAEAKLGKKARVKKVGSNIGK